MNCDLYHTRVGVRSVRHLERRLPVSGLERGLACHPERSEGSGETDGEILRCAQDDMPYLQMSREVSRLLHIYRIQYGC